MNSFLLYRVRAGRCLGCVALLFVPGCLWEVTIPSEPQRTSGMSWFPLLVRSVGRRRSWSTPWAWSPDHGSLR
jgi:hypothetical protein